MKAWLRLFRVVNLPTVPGDVLVGAAAVLCTAPSLKMGLAPVWWTAASSVFLYMFGLAQNDVFGAKTDKDRPIPEGLISIRAVRSACAICLFLAWIVTWFPFRAHPGCFWLFSVYIVMTILVSVYNATKISLLMGLCRGLNVVYGGVAVAVSCARGRAGIGDVGEISLLLLGAIFCIWTLYIWAVTIYSKGEEDDPAKKRRVGLLVGGIVYLQLTALIVLTLRDPRVMPLMVAGAVLLVLLRLFKKVFPEVSAS